MWWIDDGEWNGERDDSEKLSGGRVLIFEWIFVWTLKVNLSSGSEQNWKVFDSFEFWYLNLIGKQSFYENDKMLLPLPNS
jgi:hypothetical protein